MISICAWLAQVPCADEHRSSDSQRLGATRAKNLGGERIALRRERRYCLPAMERPVDRSLGEFAPTGFAILLRPIGRSRASWVMRRCDRLATGRDLEIAQRPLPLSHPCPNSAPGPSRLLELTFPSSTVIGLHSFAAAASLLKPGFSLLFRSQNLIF